MITVWKWTRYVSCHNTGEKSCGKITHREAQAGGWLSRTQGKWGRVLLVSPERGGSLSVLVNHQPIFILLTAQSNAHTCGHWPPHLLAPGGVFCNHSQATLPEETVWWFMAEAQCSHRVNTAQDLRQFSLLVWSESQKGKAIFLGSRSLITSCFLSALWGLWEESAEVLRQSFGLLQWRHSTPSQLPLTHPRPQRATLPILSKTPACHTPLASLLEWCLNTVTPSHQLLVFSAIMLLAAVWFTKPPSPHLMSCSMPVLKWPWELMKDREAWRAAVHGVTKRWTWLSDWTTSTHPSQLPACPHTVSSVWACAHFLGLLSVSWEIHEMRRIGVTAVLAYS